MDAPMDGPYVEPAPGVIKTFGILNVVFASLLLMQSTCALGMTFLQPVFMKFMQGFVDQVEAQANDRDAKIAELKRQEKAAATAEEQAQLRAERLALESQPKPPNFEKMLNQGPIVAGYSIVDASTSLVFNVLMLIAGIGLLKYRETGRVWAIRVAVLKIARLVLLQGFYAIVIIPILAKQVVEMIREMGGPGMNQMGVMQGTFMTASAVGTVLIGSVYPALCLWFLTRPGAKAACHLSEPPAP